MAVAIGDFLPGPLIDHVIIYHFLWFWCELSLALHWHFRFGQKHVLYYILYEYYSILHKKGQKVQKSLNQQIFVFIILNLHNLRDFSDKVVSITHFFQKIRFPSRVLQMHILRVYWRIWAYANRAARSMRWQRQVQRISWKRYPQLHTCVH